MKCFQTQYSGKKDSPFTCLPFRQIETDEITIRISFSCYLFFFLIRSLFSFLFFFPALKLIYIREKLSADYTQRMRIDTTLEISNFSFLLHMINIHQKALSAASLHDASKHNIRCECVFGSMKINSILFLFHFSSLQHLCNR